MIDEDGNQRSVSDSRLVIPDSNPRRRVISSFILPSSLNFQAPRWRDILTVSATIVPNSHDDYIEFNNLRLGLCDVVVSPIGAWVDGPLCIVNSRYPFEDSGLVERGGFLDSIGHQDEPFRYLLGNVRGLHSDCKPLGRMFYVQFSKNCDFLMIRYNRNAWFRGKRVDIKNDDVFESFRHCGCFATVKVRYSNAESVLLARLRAVQLVLLSFGVLWDADQDKYLVYFRGTADEDVVKACIMREVRKICGNLDLKAYFGGAPKEVVDNLVEILEVD